MCKTIMDRNSGQIIRRGRCIIEYESHGPVVMQRIETTCGQYLGGYHVSIRKWDNDEVAGAVYMKDRKK